MADVRSICIRLFKSDAKTHIDLKAPWLCKPERLAGCVSVTLFSAGVPHPCFWIRLA